jgi:hypothetical protein
MLKLFSLLVFLFASALFGFSGLYLAYSVSAHNKDAITIALMFAGTSVGLMWLGAKGLSGGNYYHD